RRHVTAVREGRPTAGTDLGDDRIGRLRIAPAPGEVGAEIVDEDRGAEIGERERVGTPDAAPGSGDDGDAPGERPRRGAPLAHAAGGSLTCGKSSLNVPCVTRARTSGATSSNSSCSVFCVCPYVPSRCG